MVKLTFEPAQDEPEINAAISHYDKLWKEFGTKIVESAKDIAGLSFVQQEIVAIVHNGASQAQPLTLHATTNRQRTRGDLVRELMQVLLVDNNVDSTFIEDDDENRRVHKVLDLVLYDVYVAVYGHKFAREQVALEKSLSPSYEQAWEWALNHSPDERQKLFKKIVEKSA